MGVEGCLMEGGGVGDPLEDGVLACIFLLECSFVVFLLELCCGALLVRLC